MESNELLKPTEDEHMFSSLSSAATTLEAQPANELKAPDVADLLQGNATTKRLASTTSVVTHNGYINDPFAY